MAAPQRALELMVALEAEGHVRDASDRLDSRRVELEIDSGKLDAGRLRELTAGRVRVELTIVRDAWTLRVDGAPGEPELSVRDDGPAHQVVADPDALETAIENGDAGAALAAVPDGPVELILTLEHDYAAGYRWIRTGDALVAALTGPDWLATVRSLFDRGEPELLVVQDGGDGLVAAPWLLVRGPDAAGERPEPERHEEPARPRPEAGPLPPPPGLVPAETRQLDGVAAALTGVARALTWYWLAAEERSPGQAGQPPEVRFSGSRVVDVALAVTPGGSAADEVRLWRWATAAAEPAREQALQQAVSLAVVNASDLPRAAGPALRTAETLLRTITKDELAEALATRREARVAAIAAGRAAAEAARNASAKTLERVIVQAAAAAGILVAHSKDALSREATLRLLALVGGLLVASGLLAMLVEYRMARGSLKTFRADLDLYRDTLSDDDIASIRTMESLDEGAAKIRWAEGITVVTLAAAAVALGLAIEKVA